MAIDLHEGYELGEGAEDGDRPADELPFVLVGSDDRDEILAALLDRTPESHPTRDLRRTGVRIIAKLGEAAYQTVVSYGPRDGFSGGETNEESFSFDTTGGTQHITQSKETIAKYPAGAPDLQGAINVTGEDVLGTDITVPAFAFTATRYVSAGDMTAGYIADLFHLTGRVNENNYTVGVGGVPLSFLAGELLFLGARGGKRARGDWEIALNFAAQPNVYGITVGGFVVTSKLGWELIWVRYGAQPVGSGANKAALQQPVALYLERLYDLDDFGLLGLGG